MVPEYVAGYSAFLHGVDNAVHYLALYPFMRETVKWPKKEETGILGLHENCFMRITRGFSHYSLVTS
jgi:hypothetical protein